MSRVDEPLKPIGFSRGLLTCGLYSAMPAAIVTRMDSLSMQVYEGPWYTMGYFAHCMPMRRLCEDVKAETSEEQPPQEKNPEKPVKEINVRELVQGEFDF